MLHNSFFFPEQHWHDYSPFSIESSIKKKFICHLILPWKCMNARCCSIKNHWRLVNSFPCCFQVRSYDGNGHQSKFSKSSGGGWRDTDQQSAYYRGSLHWTKVSVPEPRFDAVPEELVLWAERITWGVLIPKRERERKDVPITQLSGSSSHRTRQMMSAPGGQRVLLLPSSHSRPMAIKRVFFFVPIHDSLLNLVQLFPSLSHKKELKSCQTLGVFLQEMLQDHSCDVAREGVRFCTREVRQKKINVTLTRGNIYNLSTSFCISVFFNWTHYTESLVFL